MTLRKNILFLLGVLVITLTFAGCSNKSSEYDSFAQCLTEKGAVIYGTQWCSYCQSQKEMFGSSFEYINYVDCDFERSKCDKAGVRTYPTWQINGELYTGQQTMYKLASLAKCGTAGE